jgi:hypothetical protein
MSRALTDLKGIPVACETLESWTFILRLRGPPSNSASRGAAELLSISSRIRRTLPKEGASQQRIKFDVQRRINMGDGRNQGQSGQGQGSHDQGQQGQQGSDKQRQQQEEQKRRQQSEQTGDQQGNRDDRERKSA